MVTYRNITVRKKGGGTRLQRAKVLASGKLKFVKNLGTKTRSVRKTAGKRTAKARAYAARGAKILGTYGVTGAAEDLAIGYFGAQLLASRGYPLEQALPMTRVIQGAAMKALNRRGKGRLVYGIIDLVDVYLIKRGLTMQGISLAAWQ